MPFWHYVIALFALMFFGLLLPLLLATHLAIFLFFFSTFYLREGSLLWLSAKSVSPLAMFLYINIWLWYVKELRGNMC